MYDREHLSLLVEVARAYWIDRRSQETISHDVGYSRSMVSRLLAEARDLGIVTVTVTHPLEHALELERRLSEIYRLDEVYVSNASARVAPTEPVMLAVHALRESLTPDSVLAVTNGRTVAAVVDAFTSPRMPHTTVVQAIGTVARGSTLTDAPEIARSMSLKLGGAHQLLPAPLVVGTAQLASALRREGAISTTLAMAAHADVLLTGIGQTDLQHEGEIFHGLITPEEHASLVAANAVGHVCGHHVDPRGHHVDDDFCDRLIAVSFSRLRGIKKVIAVAWGDEKIRAIDAVLRGGAVNCLITDASTAQALVAGHIPTIEV